MNTQQHISPALMEYINKYRTDSELVSSEKSMIADAMCGIEIAISGMNVDNRTETLLHRAASVISSYHWLLDLIESR